MAHYNNDNNNPICKAPECQKTSVAPDNIISHGNNRLQSWTI